MAIISMVFFYVQNIRLISDMHCEMLHLNLSGSLVEEEGFFAIVWNKLIYVNY